MTQTEIITQLMKLTLIERLELVEMAVQQIRAELEAQDVTLQSAHELTEEKQIQRAVEIMLPEYTHNAELTIFSSLDGEDFYVEEPDLADKPTQRLGPRYRKYDLSLL